MKEKTDDSTKWVGCRRIRRFPLKLKSIESRLPYIDKIYYMTILRKKSFTSNALSVHVNEPFILVLVIALAA